MAYVDGSCKNNGKENATVSFAYSFTDIASGKRVEKAEAFGYGTNNLAELKAIEQVLIGIEQYCKENRYVMHECLVIVCSDSQYAIETLKNNYRIKSNASLFFEVQRRMKKFANVEFRKVSSKSGHAGNARVDKLAANAHPKVKRATVSVTAPKSDHRLMYIYREFFANTSIVEDDMEFLTLSPEKLYEIKVSIREIGQ